MLAYRFSARNEKSGIGKTEKFPGVRQGNGQADQSIRKFVVIAVTTFSALTPRQSSHRIRRGKCQSITIDIYGLKSFVTM